MLHFFSRVSPIFYLKSVFRTNMNPFQQQNTPEIRIESYWGPGIYISNFLDWVKKIVIHAFLMVDNF